MGVKLDDTEKIIIGAVLITAGLLTPGTNPQLIIAGVGFILSAADSTPNIESTIINRSITHKGPIEPWRVIYGTHRVGGIYSLVHLTGDDDDILNLIVVFSGHEIEQMGNSSRAFTKPDRVYLNGQPVDIDTGTGQVIPPPETISNITAITATNTFSSTNHKFLLNMRVRFSGSLPGGVVESQPYFIVNPTFLTYQISKRFVTTDSPTHIIDLTSIGGSFSMQLDVETPIDYTDHLFINQHMGQPNQTADGTAVAVIGDTGIWSTAHRLRGRAYVFMQLTWNRDIFPNGIPNITLDIKGKRIWDPRIGGDPDVDIAFSANSALVVADYLMDTEYGLGAAVEEINQAKLIVAANICDELVTLASPATGSEPRYESNGSFRVDKKPATVIKELLTAMSGKLVRVSGRWEIYAGAFITPTETYDEGDLSATIKVQNLIDRRDNANGIRGTFVSPLDNWQPTSYPEVTSAGALSGDQGRENFKEMGFPWTLSPSTAQRLAKIELHRLFEELSVDLQGKLTMFKSQPPDVIQLSNDRFGWTNKDFEITSAGLVIGQDGGLNYKMRLREANSAIYDWDGSIDETDFVTVRNSSLPSPFRVAAPTNLVLTSGTNELFIRLDGTIFSRIHAVWTAPADQFVISGGTIEVQFKKSADSVFLNAPITNGSETETFLLDVEDGISYDVRIRSRNTIGVTSDYITVSDHIVIGKTAPPEDVTGFTAAQNSGAVVLIWNPNSDIDLAGYVIRYIEQTAEIIWENARLLTELNQSTNKTTAAIPPGDWNVLIRAKDTSGNLSTNTTSDTLTVSNLNNIISDFDVNDAWVGDKGNLESGNPVSFIKHHTGPLIPQDKTWAADNGFDTFDKYLQDPYDESVFTTIEGKADFRLDDPVLGKLDQNYNTLGGNALGTPKLGFVRVTATVDAIVGPQEVLVTPDVLIEIRSANIDDPSTFGPWTPLTILEGDAYRFQLRLRLDNTTSLSKVLAFNILLDAPPLSENDLGVQIEIGGTRITFEKDFLEIPTVTITAIGNAVNFRVPVHEDRTIAGFTAFVLDNNGNDVGGEVDWVANSF